MYVQSEDETGNNSKEAGNTRTGFEVGNGSGQNTDQADTNEQGQIGHSEAQLRVGDGHEMKTGQGVGNNKADLGAGNKSGQCTDQEQVSEQDQERSQPNRNSLAVNSTMSELGIGSRQWQASL